MCAWPKPQFWGKHLVNQFDGGLNQRYRAYLSTSSFLRERLDVDSEMFSRVFRVTEILAEGCSQRLENLGVKETTIFVPEITGACAYFQTANEESCVKILHIKAKLLVVPILDIYKAKSRSCISWNLVVEGLSP